MERPTKDLSSCRSDASAKGGGGPPRKEEEADPCSARRDDDEGPATDPRPGPPPLSSLDAPASSSAAPSRSSAIAAASLLDSEAAVRRRSRRSPLYLFFVENGVSVFLLFSRHFLFVPQTIFGLLLTLVSTLVSYRASEDAASSRPDGWYGGSMPWALLSLAVVTPMVSTVKMAFERRERALRSMEAVRATSYQLYMAHAAWDWTVDDSPGGKAGRVREGCGCICGCGCGYRGCKDWREHSDAVLSELLGLGDDLRRALTLPEYTRARHRVTRSGRVESSLTAAVSRRFYDSAFARRMPALALLAEDLKRAGIALPETIRIRKWERILCGSVESLRFVKAYRTPQALRSFARIFAVFLPPLYGPTFAQLARDAASPALGICFGLLSSLALNGLFAANGFLEDPFLAELVVDGIDVAGELVALHRRELLGAREEYFPDAPPFVERRHDRRSGEG